jgi:NAD(P)-dependent dehydrogenase (short-subunit alcohol dehydrogenase family)
VYTITLRSEPSTASFQRSENPVIVNVSSGMGSIAVTNDPERLESTLIGIAYPASKTAVNMITTQYAKAFPEFRINAFGADGHVRGPQRSRRVVTR